MYPGSLILHVHVILIKEYNSIFMENIRFALLATDPGITE